MAERIQRQTQKIFGGKANTDELAVFGSMNTGTPIYTDNIETLQSNAYEEGWSSAVAANEAPWLEELNGVQYGLSKQLSYQFQEGVPEWDANTTYFKGSIAKSSDGTGTLYTSSTDNNLGNPLTDTENWTSLQGTGSGAPIGSIFPTFCSDTYVPANCLPCNGSEYSSEQFESFYTNYLVSGKLLTCTYEEYSAAIETYGKCAKFALDTTDGTFKTPYLPNGSFIQQAMSNTELGKAYQAGLPSMTLSEAGSHTHTRGTMEITGQFKIAQLAASNMIRSSSGAFSNGSPYEGGNNQAATNNNGWSQDVNFKASNNWTGETSSNGSHTHTLNSSVLGKSSTVQPASIALRWFVVVGTGAINEADMDWSEWATSLNGRANTDLSNLSAAGEKHFLNKTQITNCLLEVPQSIKYTLENGTLTIKAGSVVIVPYGTEDLMEEYSIGSTFVNANFKVVDSQFADGKFLVWIEIQEDISSYADNNLVAKRPTLINLTKDTLSAYMPTISSSTAVSEQDCNVYRTDLNLVQSVRSSVIQNDILSLPVLLSASGNGQLYNSVKQLFNGCGYIGSVVWIDKGVKALIPNGRNEDGTLNNIELTTSYLKMLSSGGGDHNWTLAIDTEGNLAEAYSAFTFIQSSYPIIYDSAGHEFWYNPVANETTDFSFGVPNKKPMLLLQNLYVTDTSTNIYELNSTAVTTFKAVDEKDIDGKWVFAPKRMISEANIPANYDTIFDISDYLPQDENMYEIVVQGTGSTAASAGGTLNVMIGDPAHYYYLMMARTQSAYSTWISGSTRIFVQADRKVRVLNGAGVGTGKIGFIDLLAYRKVI